jgi:RNA polymerase sigma-32 factor
MSKELTVLNAASMLAIDSVDSYMNAIASIPVLSVEEERELALEYYTTRSLEAARRLTVANLRFVAHIARSYSGYGLSQMDLIQEGNIGLMKAVKKFDPSKNVRLISFAVHWIKSEIHEFIVRNWRMVKIATTKEQRKLFFNLRKNMTRLGWLNEEEVQRIAADLDVRPEAVVEMEKRIGMPDMAFDPQSDEDSVTAPAHYLTDGTNPDEAVEYADTEDQRTESMQHALMALDDRSADIVKKRWLDEKKLTLNELASLYGISAERVRQLEQAAFTKMRQLIPAV